LLSLLLFSNGTKWSEAVIDERSVSGVRLLLLQFEEWYQSSVSSH